MERTTVAELCEHEYTWFMTTSIHLPGDLLTRLDRRAGEMRTSRNRLIVHAIERMLVEDTSWSTAFLDELRTASEDTDGHHAVTEMLNAIHGTRTRKTAPRL